jgi:hypothetical protein
MTKDEALKMAMDELYTWIGDDVDLNPAWRACKEALEQPAQEPKPHEIREFVNRLTRIAKEFGHTQQLREQVSKEVSLFYTHPHQFIGLTDDEIGKLFDTVLANDEVSTEFFGIEFARAIEQALKEKNT